MNYFPFHIGDYASATRHLSWDEDAAYRRLLDVYYTTEKPIPTDLRAVYRLVMAQTDSQREAVAVVLSEFFVLAEDGHHNKRADDELADMRAKQERQSAKDAHETDRMRRYRERRAELFAALRGVGIVPAWDVPMKDLQRQFDDHCNAHATHLQREQVRTGNADATAIPTPTPTPTPKERDIEAIASHPERRSGVHRFPPGFDEFWSAYPRKVGKDAAAKAFAKRRVGVGLLAQMLAAISVQKTGDQWQRDGGQFIPHPATWLNEGRWQDETSCVETVDSVFGAAL